MNGHEASALFCRYRSLLALMTAMRQIGVGSEGGEEALAILHQLIFNDWHAGTIAGSLARIKVDEKKCFGMIAEQGDVGGPFECS